MPEETGWAIPRGDHAAFRAALERFMSEPPEKRAARRALAMQAARLTFDPARQVTAYLGLFEGLIK